MACDWHIIEEERALRALRKVVDGTIVKLCDPGLSDIEATRLIELTRGWVLKVFPDKVSGFDATYLPRLQNIYQKYRQANDEG